MKHIRGIVLAAGKGTRMKSGKPKVLHDVGGIPMVNRVLTTLRTAGVSDLYVIVGHEADAVKAAIGPNVTYVSQGEQGGTAHAVLQVEPWIKETAGDVLVVNGDTPLLRPETLKALIGAKREMRADAVLLTAEVTDPTGYGRIVRSVEGWVMKIVEDVEATPEERAIREINAGVYVLSLDGLFEALKKIPRSPRKGEYYLTDLVGLWSSQGRRIGALVAEDASETLGVDTEERLKLASKLVHALEKR